MKKTVLTLLLGICLINYSAAQNFEWAKVGNGSALSVAHAIATDDSGNVYTSGFFEGTCDFDPGAGTFNLTATAASWDAYVCKMDTDGDFLWAHRFGGNGNDRSWTLALDDSGNVYFGGVFTSTVDFDPGPGVSNLVSNASSNIFICKLTSAGNFVWAKGMGGTADDNCSQLVLDDQKNIYFTGSFKGTADFDPGAGTVNLIATGGNSDAFLAKLNPAGDLIWARQLGVGFSDAGNALALTHSDHVYMTGSFGGTVDFDPGAGISNLTASTGSSSFLCKMDTAGNFKWVREAGGRKIGTDLADNVYCIGHFSNTMTIDPAGAAYAMTAAGLSDIFFCKFDSAGTFSWAGQVSGTSAEYGNALTVSASGDLYGTGYFAGAPDFDPGPGVHTLTCNSLYNMYVMKLNTNGAFEWEKHFEAAPATPVTQTHGNAICMDAARNLYVAGLHEGTADFDPGAATHYLSATSESPLVLKLTCNSIAIDTQTACGLYTWIDGNTYTASNNLAEHRISNAAGCDSIIRLHLTINYSTSATDTHTACNAFTWIDGNTYTSGTTTASYTLTNAAGCDSVITLDLTIQSVNTSVSQNGTDLSADLSGAGYQWIDCNNAGAPLTSETGQSFSPVVNGNYAVIITDGGCSDTSACMIVNNIGSKELKTSNSTLIFPNPAHHFITIRTAEALKSIAIYDLIGKLVQSEKTSSFSVAELSSGIYFVRIHTAKGAQTVRFVKE